MAIYTLKLTTCTYSTNLDNLLLLLFVVWRLMIPVSLDPIVVKVNNISRTREYRLENILNVEGIECDFT
jgi:hypothetical protein